MAVYKRWWAWSKKSRCSSREVSAHGCCQVRVVVVEEYLARFFFPEKLDSSCVKSRLLVVYGYHVDAVVGIPSKLVKYGRL